MATKRKTGDPFNRALAAFLEWGPAMSVPVDQRLKKLLPRATKTEITAMVRRFTEIQHAASAIVIDQLETRASELEGRSRVAALDPKMSPGNAATLYTQCRVSAWRDGYQ